ncbi:MAG: ATP-binding protein [Candidatus Peribacteraceae bacterium]|nr:ATP-binding protein [Candidatus Peribacteraceae bacterium]
MFNKPLSKIILADVQQLVEERKEKEGQHLDYKRELSGSDRDKREFLKDVTAFANSGGGYLIIGADEKTSTVCGTQDAVGNQKIEEWISNVLTPNIDQKVRYEIQLLPFEDRKTVIVLHIPESPRKPHMVTLEAKNAYYVRHNVVIHAATHNEVREMFEMSRRSKDAVREFMEQRNLLDDKSEHFAQNENTPKLKERIGEDMKTPLLLHSFIPLYLQEDQVKTASAEFDQWLQEHASGYEPLSGVRLYKPYGKQVHLEGIVLPEILPRSQDEEEVYYNYLEILNNGYIESGASSEFLWDRNRSFTQEGQPRKVLPALAMTQAVAYTWALLNFALTLYRKIEYLDEVTMQLSLANIRSFALGSFAKGWAEPFTWEYENPPLCKRYDNLRLVERFVVGEMSEDAVRATITSLAEKLSHAFGETRVKCFDAEGELNPECIRGFRSY